MPPPHEIHKTKTENKALGTLGIRWGTILFWESTQMIIVRHDVGTCWRQWTMFGNISAPPWILKRV